MIMADNLLQTIDERRKELSKLKSRFETLLARAQISKNKGQELSLPEFQAFGWKRLEEFLDRFEESLNVPLLENARSILREAGVNFTPQLTDSLKFGLSTRADDLIEILCEVRDELKPIQIGELQSEAKKNIVQLLEEGKWDSLLQQMGKWRELEESLKPITGVMSKDTHLFKAIFQLAVQQGPSTTILTRLGEATERASQIGGESLAERIGLEIPRSEDNPLNDIESDLTKIAGKKEELRQLRGEDIELQGLIEQDTSLRDIINSLDSKIQQAAQALRVETDKAQRLLREYNNMALILEREEHFMPPDTQELKRLREFEKELENEVQGLTRELEKSLSSNARMLIKTLADGAFPKTLQAKQIVDALRELLSKGFAFEIRPLKAGGEVSYEGER